MRGLRCPLCDVPMREVPRRGVMIDVCPECRGVWLDRGELNKLLETAERLAGGEVEPLDREAQPPHHQAYPPHHKRRKSFWQEIFDFDLFD